VAPQAAGGTAQIVLQVLLSTIRYFNQLVLVLPNQWRSFIVGTTTYLIDADTNGGSVQMYKWMPAPANANKGCFGDGITCGNGTAGVGNIYSLLSIYIPGHWWWLSLGVDVYQKNGMTDASSTYITFFDTSNSSKATTFRWVQVNGTNGCPAWPGGLGDGTNCLSGATPQTYQQFQIPAGFSTFYTGKSFAVGNDAYLAIAGPATSNYIYKWVVRAIIVQLKQVRQADGVTQGQIAQVVTLLAKEASRLLPPLVVPLLVGVQ
jgi:hypothetical protein